MRYRTSVGVFAIGLSATSCTAVLGIDKDYHEGRGVASSTSGSGAGGADGSSGTTTSTMTSASATSSGAGGGAAASCADILQANQGSPSGVYTLTPAASPPFKAFCEMTSDGGGWTLVLKIDGTKPTFEWDSSHWKDNNPYNQGQPDLDATEAKLPSFSEVQLSAVRLGMIDAGMTRWIVVPAGKTTTLAKLLTTGTTASTNIGRATWKKLVASPSLQVNCNAEGFDVHPGSGAMVRIGIVANDQMNCDTEDSVLGFGIDALHGGNSCGNFASYGGDNGDRNTATFGYVMVR